MEDTRLIAPKGIIDKQHKWIIQKKAPTIFNKLRKRNEITEPPLPKKFINGKKLSYLERNYRLKVYK